MSLYDFVCKRSEIMLQCQLHSAQNHYLAPQQRGRRPCNQASKFTCQSHPRLKIRCIKLPQKQSTLLLCHYIYIVDFANWSNVGQFQKRALDLSCFLSNLSTSELRFNLSAGVQRSSTNHSDPTCLKRKPSNICNMQLF